MPSSPPSAACSRWVFHSPVHKGNRQLLGLSKSRHLFSYHSSGYLPRLYARDPLWHSGLSHHSAGCHPHFPRIRAPGPQAPSRGLGHRPDSSGAGIMFSALLDLMASASDQKSGCAQTLPPGKLRQPPRPPCSTVAVGSFSQVRFSCSSLGSPPSFIQAPTWELSPTFR